jgi:hypothetical protein
VTGRRSHILAVLFVLAGLAATGVGCGGDNAAAVATTATAPWQKVAPAGDCECADGSQFAFWERRADPTKVVFFLDGGGACYDAETDRGVGSRVLGLHADRRAQDAKRRCRQLSRPYLSFRSCS